MGFKVNTVLIFFNSNNLILVPQLSSLCQFSVFSTIPVGYCAHSHDTKLHPDYTYECTFLWKFFCSLFLPRVIPHEFFPVRSWRLQHTVQYVTPFDFFLFLRLYPIRFQKKKTKEIYISRTVVLNMNFIYIMPPLSIEKINILL